MSAPIGPGDLAVYIGPSDPAAHRHGLLTVGSVYLVVAIEHAIGVDGDLYEGFVLDGIDGWAFAPTSFRPIEPRVAEPRREAERELIASEVA